MIIKKHKKALILFAAIFIFYTIIDGAFSIYRENKGDSISLNVSSPTVPITVHFNANGGTVSPESKQIIAGTEIGALPTPEYIGHEFAGWYTDPSIGTEITASTIFNAETTIYAHWVKEEFDYVFYIPGECTFTGSAITNGPNGNCISTINTTGSDIDYTESSLSAKKYIDTLIGLYDSNNHDKDYEIGLTIVSYDPDSNPTRSTLVNSKAEVNTSTTKYPGLTFRKDENTSDFLLQSRNTLSANAEARFASADVQSVKIYRTSDSIYYSIDGGTKTKLNDLNQYNPVFDLTTWFGAAPSNATATAAQRFFVGTLSKMYIKIKEDPSNKATITYDPNYTDAPTFSEKYTKGQAIGTLPNTLRTGYTLVGWFDDPSGGNQITSSTVVTADDTYYAHWHENITVTLHTNDGTGVPNTITVPYNQPIGTIPTPTKTDYTFVGWFQDSQCTIPVTTSTIVTTDTDFYADWLPNVTVTFNANGGYVSPSSKTVGQGTAIGEMPTPTKTGNTFDGWYQDSECTIPATEQTIINSSTIFHAKWIENITVTFNAKGGTVTPNTVTFPLGTAIGPLPTPNWPGHTFSGWFIDDETYQIPVTDSTVFNASTQIYAKWEETTDITIGLNADGGTVSPSTITIPPETAIGPLPTPTNTPDRTGYVFAGWYTDNTWTTEVTAETTFATNTTIIAKWVEDTYVACIGNTCYTTLAIAVNNVPDSGAKTTIKIIQDIAVTTTVTIPNTKWVEFDIGTHTISTSTNNVPILTNYGKLDIINGTLYSSGGYVINNKNNGVLNISGGTLTYQNSSHTENKVLSIDGGTVNITGGTLTGNSRAATINVNGGALNISGGVIKASNTYKGQAIYNDTGTTTISGNVYIENVSDTSSNGRAAVHNNAGTVTILGGTIVSKGNAAVKNNDTMTIGASDGTISTTNPVIQGHSYGLETVSGTTTYIYDGIFKGKVSTNNKAISNESDVNTGTYNIVHGTETIDTVQYVTAYLVDPAATCTVTFNPGENGTVSPLSKTFTAGTEIGELPTPDWTGHTFSGWYTAASGGTAVTTQTVFSNDDTIYAHWDENLNMNFNTNSANAIEYKPKTLTGTGPIVTLPSSPKNSTELLGWLVQQVVEKTSNDKND